MKKINYLVLMAAMMLIGTNVWATDPVTHNVGTKEAFTTAWADDAVSGDTIRLTDDIALTATVWLGTEALTATDKYPLRSLVIDLNGYELSSSATYAFMLTHGSLTIVNTRAASGGKLIGSSTCTNVFYITGSANKDIDPSEDKVNKLDYFTHLEIAEGVIVKHDKYDGAISIDGIWSGGTAFKKQTGYIPSKPALKYITNVYAGAVDGANKCVAHGVRVDVKGTINGQKYGIKSNGYLGNPTYYFETRPQEGNVVAFSSDLLPTDYKILATDIQYAPYIHVYPTAKIKVSPDLDPKNDDHPEKKKNPVAIYAAGYARWKVEGYAEGCNGAVIKSGQVDFTDAQVVGTGTYAEATPSTSGSSASGSGIIIASTDAYAGGIDVSIGGDTEISSKNGYALEEVITSADEKTDVEKVTITGGSFEGSASQGTIVITETTTDNETTQIEVSGGQVKGDPSDESAVNIGGLTLTEFLEAAAEEQGKTHVTVTTDENGKDVMVIVSGETPKQKETIADYPNQAVNWRWSGLGDDPMEEDITANLKLDQLQINQDYNQTVTVKDGVTLEVGSVILGANAKIIVEPGATFIVSKKDGIYAPLTSNLILQTQDGKPSIFLFNPAVSTNAHPHATVQFKSMKSFAESAANHQFERFGLPTWKAVSSIECDQTTLTTNIQVFGASGWENLGNLTNGSTFANKAKLDKPWIAFALLANTGSTTPAEATYSFGGELTGNDNPELDVFTEWTPFANSYSANIDVEALLAGVASGVEKTVYIGAAAGNGKYVWDAFAQGWTDGRKLAPMEAFILHNKTAAAKATSLNYNSMVWTPATTPASAPRRAAVNSSNTAKLRIVVEDAQGVWDNVKMTECTGLDNATKYMNDNVNLFARANDEKLAIVAAEDLDGTYFGFSTVEGGVFTISFANVEGREFEFVDLETNKTVKVAEGNTYTFTAAPNTTADYRFKLVGIKKVPTAVDNIDAAKNQTGIYTLLGQYVGELNHWNSLPAGVYVVNGEKCVK